MAWRRSPIARIWQGIPSILESVGARVLFGHAGEEGREGERELTRGAWLAVKEGVGPGRQWKGEGERSARGGGERKATGPRPALGR